MEINTFSKTNLFMMITYTDLKAGNIIEYVPTSPDGAVDSTRFSIFFGQTTMQTNKGPIQIQFPIQAISIETAADSFDQALRDEISALESRMLKSQIINGSPLDLSKLKG